MSFISMCLAYSQLPLRTCRRDQRGATFVEYALLTALIAVVCVLAVSFIGSATNESFSSSADRL